MFLFVIILFWSLDIWIYIEDRIQQRNRFTSSIHWIMFGKGIWHPSEEKQIAKKSWSWIWLLLSWLRLNSSKQKKNIKNVFIESEKRCAAASITIWFMFNHLNIHLWILLLIYSCGMDRFRGEFKLEYSMLLTIFIIFSIQRRQLRWNPINIQFINHINFEYN